MKQIIGGGVIVGVGVILLVGVIVGVTVGVGVGQFTFIEFDNNVPTESRITVQ